MKHTHLALINQLSLAARKLLRGQGLFLTKAAARAGEGCGGRGRDGVEW